MAALALLLQLPGAAATAPQGVEWALVDVVQQRTYVVSDRADKLAAGGELRAVPQGSQVELAVGYEAGQRGTVIRVHLADQAGQDRGLVVRLSLKLPEGSMRWWQDLDTALPLAEGPLANTTALRGLPGLPEFPQGERPEYGLYSIYPLGVVSGGGSWLALGRPMSQLALVRFSAVGGAEPLLTAEVDLALSEYTKPPREADFTLWCLSGEGKTPPMRAALQRYYDMQPEDWRVRVPAFGGWMPFQDLAQLPNVDEFGLMYQEGGGNPGFDDALGALSFVYFHCAGEFAKVPGYQRGTEPLPPYEEVLKAFNAVAKQHTGIDGAWGICGIQGPDGKTDYRPEQTYGDFFCQACVDPDLPYGKAMAEQLIARVVAEPSPKGIDGVYYDGVAAGLDYAPEHLRAANHLLLWDAKLGRPVNYNLWSSVEWAKSIHERLAGTGKLTMLNDSSVTSFPFVGSYIDVPGAEMGIDLDRATARHIRSFTFRKPFCTLVKADFSQVSQPLIETYMRRCVAYGILFGFFDISPSGDHPGSSYWEHPEWQDRDRALFRRYAPVATELAAKGWEPDTMAEVDGDGAFVERFGAKPTEEGAYLVLSSDPVSTPEHKQAVTVAPAPELLRACGGDQAMAAELLTGRIEPAVKPWTTEMTGDDLAVWAVGAPAQLATACADRAKTLLARRARYVEASRAGSALLAPWAPYGDDGAKVASPGHESRYCLEAQKDKPGDAGASQTIVVNHDRPRPIVVSAWSKAENVSGQKDNDYALYVDCYYTDGTAIYGQTVPFTTGTHDWEFGERTTEPTKPIRNVNVYLLFRGAHTGRVWFDDVKVALADEPGNNLLPRGALEPTPSQSRLSEDGAEAQKVNECLARLDELLGKPVNAVDWEQGESLLAETERASREAAWGADTERTLRDVDDLRWHLALARACLGGKPRPAQRESRLTELEQLETLRVSSGPLRYRAGTGKLPPGTIITVDSNYPGYGPSPLTDGQINPEGTDWTRVAWASDEGDGPHWIELRFPQPTPLREVRVWWAKDVGRLHTSQKVELQVQKDGVWAHAEGQTADVKPEVTTLRLSGAAVPAIRIYQSPRGGSTVRPGLMWVTEIEVE